MHLWVHSLMGSIGSKKLEVGTEGMTFMGISWSPSSQCHHLSLCFLAVMSWASLLHHMYAPCYALPYLWPKSYAASPLCTETSESMNSNKPLCWFLSGILSQQCKAHQCIVWCLHHVKRQQVDPQQMLPGLQHCKK
jgi:hypothetical protein